MSYSKLLKGRRSGDGLVYLVTTVTFERRRRFVDWHEARIVVAGLRKLHEEQLADTLAFK